MSQRDLAFSAKRDLCHQLGHLTSLVGVGVADDEQGLRLVVMVNDPSTLDRIPSEYHDIKVVGRVVKQPGLYKHMGP
jgi:hypothetical protein